MKTTRFFAAVLGIFAAVAAFADSPTGKDRITVVFDHPEKFTDIKDHYEPTDKGEAAILSQVTDFLKWRGDQLLPAGDKLTITFTDIDLAGDFEPWHGPQWDDVRIVKSIYPPAFKFSWTVTDASGQTLKSGTENIRDMSFDMRITIDQSDPLRYEKDILTDWMREHLRNLKHS